MHVYSDVPQNIFKVLDFYNFILIYSANTLLFAKIFLKKFED